MVANHFRWDFIGLSTDEKPTPATSSKVADGSTFYCSDNSKLYIWYKNQWYEKTATGGGGGGGSDLPITVLTDADANYENPEDPTDKYIAAWLLDSGTYILDPEATIPILFDSRLYKRIWVTTDEQPSLIVSNYDGTGVECTLYAAYLTTYYSIDGTTGEVSYEVRMSEPFTGTNGSTLEGTSGLVPAPTTSDEGKYLKSDGTWDSVAGLSVVQSKGNSTTSVMSQNAATNMIFADPDSLTKISIRSVPDDTTGDFAIGIGDGAIARGESSIVLGTSARVYAAGNYSIAIGNQAKTDAHQRAIAIGNASESAYDNSVALGTNSLTTRVGEVNVGAGNSGRGYSNTNYRVIGGVHDGQLANDAVTVGQVNSVIDAINAALSTNISHIGA